MASDWKKLLEMAAEMEESPSVELTDEEADAAFREVMDAVISDRLTEALAEEERAREAEELDRLTREERKREKARRSARRAVDAEELAAGGVSDPVIESFAEGAAHPETDDEWVTVNLLPEDGRLIISAFRKSGKTVLALNLLRSLVTGEPFLNHFDIAASRQSVTWWNLELTVKNARRWMRRMEVPEEAARRMHAMHLRDALHHYIITTDDGRERAVRALRAVGTEVWVIDPVAPLLGACGLSGSDDKDVAVFQATVNRIAAEAGIREVIYIAHVGKNANAGDETAKGSTRWEDGVDSILVLGRAEDSDKRWVRSVVRDGEDLMESTLVYDPTDMSLSLDLSADRASVKLEEAVKRVVRVVIETPGLNKTDLRTDPRAKGIRSTIIDSAIAAAVRGGFVHAERVGSAILHYPTGVLPDGF